MSMAPVIRYHAHCEGYSGVLLAAFPTIFFGHRIVRFPVNHRSSFVESSRSTYEYVGQLTLNFTTQPTIAYLRSLTPPPSPYDSPSRAQSASFSKDSM